LFSRPILADTWDRLCREATGATREARIDAARRAWISGLVADSVDRFFRGTDVLDVTGPASSRPADRSDFAQWSATVEDPAAYDYHGHTVLKCGPWSQGPVFFTTLALLRGFDIRRHGPVRRRTSSTPSSRPRNSLTPTAKLTMAIEFSTACRSVNCCRMDTNDARRKLIEANASMELRPGTIQGYAAEVDRHRRWSCRHAVRRYRGAGEPTVADWA